jgi:hypothetical protein
LGALLLILLTINVKMRAIGWMGVGGAVLILLVGPVWAVAFPYSSNRAPLDLAWFVGKNLGAVVFPVVWGLAMLDRQRALSPKLRGIAGIGAIVLVLCACAEMSVVIPQRRSETWSGYNESWGPVGGYIGLVLSWLPSVMLMWMGAEVVRGVNRQEQEHRYARRVALASWFWLSVPLAIGLLNEILPSHRHDHYHGVGWWYGHLLFETARRQIVYVMLAFGLREALTGESVNA